MKILVLGGTGAIGVDLVQILADRGSEVHVTSRQERKSKHRNIIYIKGNAQNKKFLDSLLITKYDAIVDFMSYDTDTFAERVGSLLDHTKQYVYLSSSRVYADIEGKLITEESDRLLDTINDKEYLSTDEYALTKARQEDILKTSGKTNWTIVRPYITYSNIRLQLGIFEKELWLYRALKGRTIVFGEDVAAKYTTLTLGRNVALALADIIGNNNCIGQIYHLAQDNFVKWENVLQLYLDVIEKKTKQRPKVLMTESLVTAGAVTGRTYQLIYDRYYNRRFDSSKIDAVSTAMSDAVLVDSGLSKCLEEFLDGNQSFREMSWNYEGYADKLTGEHTPLKEIPGMKNKIKYLVARYTKYFERRG